MEPYFFTETWFSESSHLKLKRKLIPYLIHSYKENKSAIQALIIYLMLLYPIAKIVAVALARHLLGEEEKVSSILIRHNLGTMITL